MKFVVVVVFFPQVQRLRGKEKKKKVFAAKFRLSRVFQPEKIASGLIARTTQMLSKHEVKPNYNFRDTKNDPGAIDY